MEEKLKSYYMEKYPTDELGAELDEHSTFRTLAVALAHHQDVDEAIGVGDSVIRERLFQHLADLEGVDYGVVYDLWLES